MSSFGEIWLNMGMSILTDGNTQVVKISLAPSGICSIERTDFNY